MIALGTKLICREFGHEVIVTNMDNEFIDYVGDNSEGSVRSENLEDFYLVGDEKSSDDTSGQ